MLEDSVREATAVGRRLAEGRAAQDATRPMRLLCVDDNDVNRQVIDAMVAPLGAEVVMAENGRQAVEAWGHGDFDLIFMDWRMPIMDGVEATAEIRRLERAAGRRWTPIVAVSAEADRTAARRFFEAGMDGVVPKPIQPAILFEAMLAALHVARQTKAA